MMILDKLVAIRCRDQDLLRKLSELAYDDRFAPTMAEVERCAADGTQAPAQPDGFDLYKQIVLDDLLDLFRGGPKLSEIEPDDLLTLTKFSDVQPDSKTMFRTADPIFMRLADLSKQGPVVLSKLMLDDFCQLAVVAEHFTELWDNLQDLAAGAGWTEDMLAIELFLSDRQSLPAYPAAASLAQAVAAAVLSDGTPLSNIVLTPPRFSGVLAEEVIAYHTLQSQLPDPDSLIDKQYTPDPSPMEIGRMLAKHAFEKLKPETRKRIERGYTLRLDALRELTLRRIFVKRDILEHVWPSLYDRMQRDFAGLLQFEKQILQPETCTEEELAKLRPFLQDERLVRVFNLQPYFGHLMDGPAPSTTASPQGQTAHVTTSLGKSTDSGLASAIQRPPSPPVFADLFPAVAGTADQSSTGQITAPPFFVPSEADYEDIYLSVERSDPTVSSYRVTLTKAATQRHVEYDGVVLNWDEIRGRVQQLQFSRDAREGGPLSAHPDSTSQLKNLGLMVYDSIFRGPVRDELLSMLSSSRNLRLHWLGDPGEPASSALPWECLFIPSAPVSFLALTRKYSLTRRYAEAKSMPVSPIGQKVRVLFVAASPSGLAPLPGIAQEIATVRSVLDSSGRTNFQVVENATVEAARFALREFRPHVFHFSGHGVYRAEAMTGELVFQTDSGAAHLVTSEQLATMLYENDVSLALLNGCDTGVSSTNDALSSAAGALVKAGVPAVVATMREVMDEAATRFSREFYRSFVAGFTVEGCMGEARKALNMDNWDWSPYALFVGSADLNKLRVSGPARSQQ